MDAGRLNRRVTIQHRVESQDPMYGTPIVAWEPMVTVWAEVQDILPSRGEDMAEVINLARRPARVRMRWRDDVDMTMRLIIDGRTLEIIAGPAELGYREGIELMAEELST
ncbi:SPP1 family predicted phage head-tail adaptor [Sphingobium wenxiniae]|uniref:SPP1 family predicted phage head-tail adaptor n=1 Tax=Sphingobium wenxiniae (strain DSM 21828 / CGMCC 1.7748 / JZ-1) TaxID=595605 RepID=A0A562KIZ5_SPHWJ|nr:phage head closure protein [Sphingobium wenxiniae]MBB6192867.1 SPP1 family predicted phage head-tail adaptor [Sphingobium wenxiniae]TWH95324.1 SPP1 family predicted phage head-tail adaptor [Sphingobium wenxiniae]